jgi:hypothetical protein
VAGARNGANSVGLRNLTIDERLLRRETVATLMIQSSANDTEAEIVNYVPGEIAVVVRVDGIDDGAAFYDHVRGRLNQRLVELLKRARERPDSPGPRPLEQDLTPVQLLERFGRSTSPLQPLGRPRALQPWLALRRGERGLTTWHLYYQLGARRASLRGVYQPALQLTRELVLLFNTHLPGEPLDSFRGQAWSVITVNPNWLTAAAPFSCGSPAGLPLPIRPATRKKFEFVDADVEAALTCERPADVFVAVLDTCPEQEVVDAAAKKFAANDLLQAVRNSIAMNRPALLPNDAFDHLAGCMPRMQWNMHAGPAYQQPHLFKMADHGLFAAGIVNDITARCNVKVFLIRVLNEYGLGDVLSIGHALLALPQAVLGTDTPGPDAPRLVVNLSLGADVPIPARLLERWLPRTAADPAALSSHLPEVCQILDSLHGNISDVMSWLAGRGILIVAAAGNDALRKDVTPDSPPPPRYPARYDNVLGVAAMRRNLTSPANYSNRGDVVLQSGSGHIATFGGNVDDTDDPAQAPSTSLDDSIVGIVSSRLTGGKGNRSGWALWAGTSFSTPIISAAAARLWAGNPGLGPQQVAVKLRSLARAPHGGTDPDSPLEVPVLRVKQE